MNATTLQHQVNDLLASREPQVEVLLVELSGSTARIYIDHPDGVTLELCERVTRAPRDGQRSFTGQLVGVSDSDVTIAAEAGVIAIPYDDIHRSNLVEE